MLEFTVVLPTGGDHLMTFNDQYIHHIEPRTVDGEEDGCIIVSAIPQVQPVQIRESYDMVHKMLAMINRTTCSARTQHD